MKNIPNKELIDLTIELISENPSIDINTAKVTRKRDFSNFWNMLSLRYFKKITFQNALKLNKSWHRLTSGYAKQVNTCYTNTNCVSSEENIQFKIKFTPEEWVILQTFVVRNIRSSFSHQFSDFLSKKLQNIGIKCWVRCKHNWFRRNKSRKANSPFWNGVYICIDSKCKQIFKTTIIEPLEINSLKDVILFVEKNNEESHTEKISKNIVCSSLKRISQANELFINKPLNCKTSNILHNVLQDNQNGLYFIIID